MSTPPFCFLLVIHYFLTLSVDREEIEQLRQKKDSSVNYGATLHEHQTAGRLRSNDNLKIAISRDSLKIR
jgi:hypothetical protein